MWVVLIRHGESMNNYLESKDPEEYERKRDEDPVLSPNGMTASTALGGFLKEKNIRFDHCKFKE